MEQGSVTLEANWLVLPHSVVINTRTTVNNLDLETLPRKHRHHAIKTLK
jgi:hypothetical protein